MNATSLLYVALGGAIGSVARALAAELVPAGRLPWATIAVNVTGSLLIGWLLARFAAKGEHADPRIPFGAPLCAAIWLTWLYGPVQVGG